MREDGANLKHKQMQSKILNNFLCTELTNSSQYLDYISFNLFKLTSSQNSVKSKCLQFAILASGLEHAKSILSFELLFCDAKIIIREKIFS